MLASKTSHLIDIIWGARGFILLLAIGFIFFPSAGRDDVHITYWSAYSLSNYGEILNYNGAWIEQSSSLLHVLLLALIAKASTLEMPFIGTIFSIFFGILTIFLTSHLSNIINKKTPEWAIGVLMGTSAFFIYWSFGGLETTLSSFVTLFVILMIYLYLSKKNSLSFSLLFLLSVTSYLMVRPENILVIICTLIGVWIVSFLKRFQEAHFIDNKKILALTLAILIVFASLALLRYFLFDSFFPQPVYAKSGSIEINRLVEGLTYLKQNIKNPDLFALVVLAALSALFLLKNKIQDNLLKLLLSMYFYSHLGFIIFSGGDWMEAGRFIVPIIPIMMILSLNFLEQINLKKLIAVLLILNIFTVYSLISKYSTSMPLWNFFYLKDAGSMLNSGENNFSFFEKSNRVHLRDIPLAIELEHVVKEISDNSTNKITLMSGQAGFVVYHISKNHFKKINFIDLQGLTTRHTTSCHLTSKFQKSQTGTYLPIGYFFAHLNDFRKLCGLPAPDIIFDLFSLDGYNSTVAEFISKNGYTIVYVQYGEIKTGSSVFKGSPVGGDQFIAVRNDLLKFLKITEKNYFDFESMTF